MGQGGNSAAALPGNGSGAEFDPGIAAQRIRSQIHPWHHRAMAQEPNWSPASPRDGSGAEFGPVPPASPTALPAAGVSSGSRHTLAPARCPRWKGNRGRLRREEQAAVSRGVPGEPGCGEGGAGAAPVQAGQAGTGRETHSQGPKPQVPLSRLRLPPGRSLDPAAPTSLRRFLPPLLPPEPEDTEQGSGAQGQQHQAHVPPRPAARRCGDKLWWVPAPRRQCHRGAGGVFFTLLPAQGVEADGDVPLLDGIPGHARVAGVEGGGGHGQAERVAVPAELSPRRPRGAAELPGGLSPAAGRHPAPQGDVASLGRAGEHPGLDLWLRHGLCLGCKQSPSRDRALPGDTPRTLRGCLGWGDGERARRGEVQVGVARG